MVRRGILIISALMAAGEACAADDALRWIPAGCDAVAVVRVRQLTSSGLGKRLKWADKERQAYAEGLLSAPPSVDQIVKGLTLGASAEQASHSYTVFSMRLESAIGDMARHELAKVERVAGKFAYRSPRNIYFIQLAPRQVGGVQPPDSAAAAQWFQTSSKGEKPQVSPFLQRAVLGNDKASVAIAVDLEGKVTPEAAARWVASKKSLNADVAPLLAKLRGFVLSITVDDTIQAQLLLAFSTPVGGQAANVKTAVAEWVNEAGAHMPFLQQAQATAQGNSLRFQSTIDEPALHRVLTLLQSPHPSLGETATAEAGAAAPTAVASARYYETVVQYLKNLDTRSQNADDYLKTAQWHESFAQKIGDLPQTGVDPELLKWGQDTSQKLRALASSLRGLPAEVDSIKKSVRFDTQTYYRMYAIGPNGPIYYPRDVGVNSNLAEVQAKASEAVEKNAGERDAIWKMIGDETVSIGQQMQSKYNITLPIPR